MASPAQHSMLLPHRPTLKHSNTNPLAVPHQSQQQQPQQGQGQTQHPQSQNRPHTPSSQPIRDPLTSNSQTATSQSLLTLSRFSIPSHPPQSSAPQSTLRYPGNRKTIYDRNLNRSRNSELGRGAFSFLFVEMVGYAQRRSKGVGELEGRLNQQGYPLGLKFLDLLTLRSAPSSTQPPTTRPTRILQLLQFITTTLWRHLFSRPADALERSAANPAEYMITDNDPIVNQFISIPREMSQLNCAAFVAGIIEGVCDGAGFATNGVSAHWAEEGGGGGGAGMWPGKTVFLIRFKDEILEREEILGKLG